MKFPFTRQLEESDCGPVCLKMISSFYGKDIDLSWLKSHFEVTKLGVSIKEITNVASVIHFDTVAVKTTIDYLIEKKPFPCILVWGQNHYVVLYEIKIKRKERQFYIAEPAFGLLKVNEEKFSEMWLGDSKKGIAVIIEPLDSFNSVELPRTAKSQIGKSLSFLTKYVILFRKYLIYTILFLSISTCISWVFPMLIQRLIDWGITGNNKRVLLPVFLSQLALISGQIFSEWFRGWFSVRLSMKLSKQIVSDFINKLILLPISFFDSRTSSDIIQRIEDHSRIESFVSNTIIQNLLQLITYIVFSVLLFLYTKTIFLIFNLASALSIALVFIIIRKGKNVTYNQYRLNFEFRHNLYEFVNGMIEIKLNVAQEGSMKKMNSIITRLFNENILSRSLIQKQVLLVRTINLVKSITITLLSAYWVIEKEMTIGVMLSVTFIIGYLNVAVESFVDFFRNAQDANISIGRIDEIFTKEDESVNTTFPFNNRPSDIVLKSVCFKYPGASSNFSLSNVSCCIPEGKVSAIVGTSGSGKTTLLKLLLSYHLPNSGEILIDKKNLNTINLNDWRKNCGIVMQSGYIFSGTIEENICLTDKNIDKDLLEYSACIACLKDFIETLPFGYKTQIGSTGVGMSGGQIQRLLIARSVYKNPNFIFFDEATSSLDANNEKKIIDNLGEFFLGKTVVIIAHRLSTVKNADQILVMEKGEIVEVGTHTELIIKQGVYYELVKNQLDLGK